MSNDGIKLEAHDLNLWYGENHALKGINISLPDKMITALIGPSGCGKSTFLRSLNRMNDLVEGCRIEGVITLGGTAVPRRTRGRATGRGFAASAVGRSGNMGIEPILTATHRECRGPSSRDDLSALLCSFLANGLYAFPLTSWLRWR